MQVRLYHDPIFVKSEALKLTQKKHKKMHEISTESGDITLIVKLPKTTKGINHGSEDEKTLEAGAVSNGDLETDKIDTVLSEAEIGSKASDCCNELTVSSMILRSSSTVFDRMLGVDMMEKKEKTIVIHAERMEDVKDLYYFMCTDTLRPDSNPLTLINLAQMYEVEGLVWKCAIKLIENISVESFASTLNLFDKYQMVCGYKRLVSFAKENSTALQKAADFDSLSHAFKYGVLAIDPE